MGKHKLLSASQTKRWVTCPGSLAFLKYYPEYREKSGTYADQGTCAHVLVEECLLKTDFPENYKDRCIEIINRNTEDEKAIIHKEGFEDPQDSTRTIFVVDEDMIEAVDKMVSYVYDRLDALGLDQEALSLERQVNPLPLRNDTGGTADVIIDNWPISIEIIDYKHGAGVFVPVESNLQLITYALGALHRNNVLDQDYEEVTYTICQPRHHKAPENGIMSETVSIGKLIEWKQWLGVKASIVDEVLELVKDLKTYMKPEEVLTELYALEYISVGDDGEHCTFCPLVGFCPAMASLTQKTAQIDFEDSDLYLSVDVSIEKLPSILRWVPVIRKWLKAVEGRAQFHLEKGEEIPGLKLVKRRTHRRWIEMPQQELLDKLEQEYGLSEKKVTKKAKVDLLTGPQVEKLVPKELKNQFSKSMLYKPEGGYEAVPESDKRPAVTINPGADFEGEEV